MKASQGAGMFRNFAVLSLKTLENMLCTEKRLFEKYYYLHTELCIYFSSISYDVRIEDVFYTSAFIQPANHSTQLCMRTLRQTCVYTKLVYTLYRAQSLSCVQTTQTFLICMYKPAGFNLILAGLLHLVCYI